MSTYCNHYHFIHNSVLLQDIIHHYDCCSGTQLCGFSSTGSTRCSSAATVYPNGCSEKFCWPPNVPHSNILCPRYLLRYMPAIPLLLPRQVFSFRVESPINSLCCMLVLVFCFQVSTWLPCSPMGAQPLRFAMLQSYGIYPWQAYVPPGDGVWSLPGVHEWLYLPLL